MRNKGFTLIELLVVIAIIALLMSILMPALARVRQQANTIVCQATLGQWGLAVSMYTGDHDGKFWLKGSNWWNMMYPYIKSEEAFLCTEATKTDAEGAQQPFVAAEYQMKELNRNVKMSYSMIIYTEQATQKMWNSTVPSTVIHAARFWGTSDVKGGNNIPIVMGSARMNTLSPFANDDPTVADSPPEYEGDVFPDVATDGEVKRVCVNRHRGYVNVTFMDGSTRKVGLKELWALKWHRTLDINAYDLPVWPNWMRQFSDVK